MINKRYIVSVSILCIVLFKSLVVSSQDIDTDEIFDKLERLEKNVSDIQKGKIEDVSKSISSGYISRNEKKARPNRNKCSTEFWNIRGDSKSNKLNK